MSSNSFRLFEAANSDWQVLTYEQFISALQTIQGDFQTCLVEFRIHTDEENWLAALFVRGQIVNLYRLLPQVQRVASNDLLAALPQNRPVLEMRSLALTPNTMRLVKILIEQPFSRTSLIVNHQDLERIIAQAGQNPDPLLLHLTWLDAQGLLLLPGKGISASQALIIGPDQVLQSSTDMNILLGRDMKNCHVRLYHSQENTPAWEEYFIFDIFNVLAGIFLDRLEAKGGSSIRNEVVRSFNFNTSANGWNISISGRTINDQAVFGSPREAGMIYQRLLNLLITQGESVLGIDPPRVLLRESLAHMQMSYRMAYKQFWQVATAA
jgi:hypothetical protein